MAAPRSAAAFASALPHMLPAAHAPLARPQSVAVHTDCWISILNLTIECQHSPPCTAPVRQQAPASCSSHMTGELCSGDSRALHHAAAAGQAAAGGKFLSWGRQAHGPAAASLAPGAQGYRAKSPAGELPGQRTGVICEGHSHTGPLSHWLCFGCSEEAAWSLAVHAGL